MSWSHTVVPLGRRPPLAPVINSGLRSRCPIFDILPIHGLSPVVCCHGTRHSLAAKSRPSGNSPWAARTPSKAPARTGVEDRPCAWHGFDKPLRKEPEWRDPTCSKETLHLLYQKRGSKLWGVILFFRLDQASGDKVRPHRKSHPFVIADYTQGIDKPIVYGSLVFLLTEIKRLINQFTTVNETWWGERNCPSSRPRAGHLDLEYDRQVMDFMILLATYGRNLLDVVRRLDTRTMPKLNHDNEPDGDIRLTKRSGKSVIVVRRLAAHNRLQDAVYHWASVAIQHDAVSKAKYAALRARGHRHARALRSVADRLIAVACAMLENQTLFAPDHPGQRHAA